MQSRVDGLLTRARAHDKIKMYALGHFDQRDYMPDLVSTIVDVFKQEYHVDRYIAAEIEMIIEDKLFDILTAYST